METHLEGVLVHCKGSKEIIVAEVQLLVGGVDTMVRIHACWGAGIQSPPSSSLAQQQHLETAYHKTSPFSSSSGKVASPILCLKSGGGGGGVTSAALGCR